MSLQVAGGARWSCTFTNGDVAATITVIKLVKGGDKSPGDFTLHLSYGQGTPNAGSNDFAGQSGEGTSFEIPTGDFAVTEDQMTGWTASYSGDCTGSAELGAGYTCTVTNTYTPSSPHYSYFAFTKVVNGDLTGWSGGTFNFTVTCNGVSTPVTLAVTTSATSPVFSFVGGGSCSVTEGSLPPAGTNASWATGPASGSAPLVLNQTVNVTLTDTRTYSPPGAPSTQAPTLTPGTTASPGTTATASPSATSTGGVKGVTGTPRPTPTGTVLPATSTTDRSTGGPGNSVPLLFVALAAASLGLILTSPLPRRAQGRR